MSGTPAVEPPIADQRQGNARSDSITKLEVQDDEKREHRPQPATDLRQPEEHVLLALLQVPGHENTRARVSPTFPWREWQPHLAAHRPCHSRQEMEGVWQAAGEEKEDTQLVV